jgi:WD40 repeat protein
MLEGHANEVRSVALSSFARLAISGSRDKTLRVWNLNSGKCLKILEGHTGPVNSVALSADGCWALSGSDDTTIRLWDVNSGLCLKTFAGHAQIVTSVAFSEDGRWALSGSCDKSLRIWELEWDYEFPKQKEWDKRVLPHLTDFLTLHCPLDDDTFGRVGKPQWNEGDFQQLLTDLQYRGFGWLSPTGIHRRLEKITTEWKGPTSAPWE